jgi:hypothetical protein
MLVADARRSGAGLLALAGALALAALTGCDPCSGVLSCSPGQYLAVDGQMVETAHGFPLPGVRIDIVRTGGITLAADSVSATSDGQGVWHVDLSPQEWGSLFADIKVSPPGLPSYRLHDVELQTKVHRGDGNLNERWTPFLYFAAYGEFFLAGTGDQRVVGATVEFRRTGGVPWSGSGVHGDVWTAVTDELGHVQIFPSSGDNTVVVTEGALLIGDFTITAPTGGVMVLRNAVLGPSHDYRGRNSYPPILRLPVPATGRDSLILAAP